MINQILNDLINRRSTATVRHVISQGGGSKELISDAVGQCLLTAERCVSDTIRQAEEACHDRQETDRAL